MFQAQCSTPSDVIVPLSARLFVSSAWNSGTRRVDPTTISPLPRHRRRRRQRFGTSRPVNRFTADQVLSSRRDFISRSIQRTIHPHTKARLGHEILRESCPRARARSRQFFSALIRTRSRVPLIFSLLGNRTDSISGTTRNLFRAPGSTPKMAR